MTIGRRKVLTAALSSFAVLGSAPASARVLRAVPERSLFLQNLHTGEKLKTVFWADGGYVPGAMREVAWVLRDHRANETHPIEPGLLDLLHALSRALGKPAHYDVISGYRSPRTNAKLAAASSGVAPRSLHTRGMAIDIRVPGVRLAALRDAAKSLGLGGVGYYPKSDFVHVDVGRVRYW